MNEHSTYTKVPRLNKPKDMTRKQSKMLNQPSRLKDNNKPTFSFLYILQIICRLLHPSASNEWLRWIFVAIVYKIWHDNIVNVIIIQSLQVQEAKEKHGT